MTSRLMLDTNVLARICHPSLHQDVKEWLRRLLERGAAAPEILVSVLADYELRRVLMKQQGVESLAHLDALEQSLRFVPLTVEASRRAAGMRRESGVAGSPSLSDGDLLMAAQAEIEGAILVTNDKAIHQIPGLTVRDWSEIDPAG